MARPRQTISDSELDRRLEALIEKLKKENNWPPVAKKRGELSKLNYLRDKLKVSFPRTRESVKRLGYYDVFAEGTRTVAQPKRIEPWVDDRIVELKESINPLTNKKYTRQEIVDQIRSEKGPNGKPGRVSLDYVARGGYGRGDWINTPKTRQEWAALHPDLESQILSSDNMVAQRALSAAKSRELRKKNPERIAATQARFLASEYGKASQRFGDALSDFKEEIRRIFPDDYSQILTGASGKSASLEELLEHPLVKQQIGDVVKESGLELDKKTKKYTRTNENSKALRTLKNKTVARFPKLSGPNSRFVVKLGQYRDSGLGLDSEKVQSLIRSRAASNLSSLKSRSIVYSWDTVDGEEVPGSKKKVANLFFADDTDEKAIREMFRRIAEDQAEQFYRTGIVSNIDHVDHIFPNGNLRIVNGKLLGGALDESGKFIGGGVANLQNLRKLAATVNMSENKILSPGRIELLKSLETPGAVSVEDTLKGLEGRTEAQRRADTKKRILSGSPRLRMGGVMRGVLPYGFGTLLGLGLAGFSDKGWASDQFKKTVKDRSFWFENLLGLHPQKVASDPRRVSPWRIGATLGQDTASGIGGLLRGLLRTDDPTEDDYVAAQQMGRSPDMSTPQIYNNGKPTGIFGHPGIRGEIIRKRRPNIWT